MFLAIIIPPARKDRVIAGVVAVGFAASFLVNRLPVFDGVSTGIKTIALTVALAFAAAVLFPTDTDKNRAPMHPIQRMLRILRQNEGGSYERN